VPRVRPATRTFHFDLAEEFEARAREIALEWVLEVARKETRELTVARAADEHADPSASFRCVRSTHFEIRSSTRAMSPADAAATSWRSTSVCCSMSE
jgi:hypothetical protein